MAFFGFHEPGNIFDIKKISFLSGGPASPACKDLKIYEISQKAKNLLLRGRIWILEDVARGANEVSTMIIMVGGGTLSSACDSKSPLSHSSDDGEVDH